MYTYSNDCVVIANPIGPTLNAKIVALSQSEADEEDA